MPLYEYICKKCGKPFETIAKHGEKPACEHCGSVSVERQLSTFAAHSASSNLPSCAQGGCPGFSGGACGSGMCGGH